MWSDIPGRAAYLWIYDEFLEMWAKWQKSMSPPNQDLRIVEVGVGLGKSIAYCARKAIDLGIQDFVDITAVDSWAGVARNGEQQEMSDIVANPDADFDLFIRMMTLYAPSEWNEIAVQRCESTVAVQFYQDRSLDLVVLDAGHTYEDVRADIAAWRPKIRPGGYMGGDDFVADFPGVEKAVREAFGDRHIEIRHDQGWGTWRVQI